MSKYSPDEKRITLAIREPLILKRHTLSIRVGRYESYPVGTVLRASCDVARPDSTKPSFERIVFLKGIDYECRYADIARVGFSPSFRGAVAVASGRYAALFNRELHDPENSLLQAMILGKTGEFPKKLRDTFARAGTAHIISISGMHMALLVIVLELVLVSLALTPGARLGVLTLLLTSYLIMVGSPAAALRSMLMAIAFIAAKYAGRPYAGMHILLLTAAAMVLTQPWILSLDIGFQLSFLAMAGMALTYEFWERVFGWLPETFLIRGTVAMTFAAQTLTWPLSAYYFQSVSAAAPVANLFLVTLLAPTLILSFIAVPASFIPGAVPVVIWPLFFMLRAQIGLTEFVGNLPGAALSFGLSVPTMLMSYLILIAGIVLLKRFKRSTSSGSRYPLMH